MVLEVGLRTVEAVGRVTGSLEMRPAGGFVADAFVGPRAVVVVSVGFFFRGGFATTRSGDGGFEPLVDAVGESSW